MPGALEGSKTLFGSYGVGVRFAEPTEHKFSYDWVIYWYFNWNISRNIANFKSRFCVFGSISYDRGALYDRWHPLAEWSTRTAHSLQQ